MAALAIILIRDALSSAEQTLLAEAEQQCTVALNELRQQFVDRASIEDHPLTGLPFEAQDFSLRGVAATVLRSYEGVQGGFLLARERRIAGFASPTLPSAQEPVGAHAERLRSIAQDLGDRAAPRIERVSDGRDWLVVAVARVAGHDVYAWSLKRLGETRDPAAEARRWRLAALVLSALIGLGGMISITVHLRRGVDSVNEGLARLESDFAYRLPEIQGDFGRISSAINQMADRRKALEKTVRQQDRLAALGKVVAGVAHEIRNPLNSIRLSLELLHRRLQRGAARGEEVRGAMEEVDRLDRILSRLLAFGRPSLEHRELQPMSPLVDRAVAMVRELSERKGVDIRVARNGSEPIEADVDALQIEQVLINLLLNAIEASPPAGAVEVYAQAGEGAIELRVKDQGPGIPPSIRDHVFDPYFTTKDSGNGLGLAVSREVVANHGGQLDFETGERGTTFRLKLPAKRGAE